MKTKFCIQCSKRKDTSEFHKNKTYKNGLNSWCKKCMNEYSKEYYIKNKEYFKNYQKVYYQKNREKIREYYRKYYQEHKRIKTRIELRVYCDNCKYIRKIGEEPMIFNYCVLDIFGVDNLNYDCKFYRKKSWWQKIWEKFRSKYIIINEGVNEKFTILNNKKGEIKK